MAIGVADGGLMASVLGFVVARQARGVGSGSSLGDRVSCAWWEDRPWAPGRAHLSVLAADGWQWRCAVSLDTAEGCGWWRYDPRAGVTVPAGPRPDLDRLAVAELGRLALSP